MPLNQPVIYSGYHNNYVVVATTHGLVLYATNTAKGVINYSIETIVEELSLNVASVVFANETLYILSLNNVYTILVQAIGNQTLAQLLTPFLFFSTETLETAVEYTAIGVSETYFCLGAVYSEGFFYEIYPLNRDVTSFYSSRSRTAKRSVLYRIDKIALYENYAILKFSSNEVVLFSLTNTTFIQIGAGCTDVDETPLSHLAYTSIRDVNVYLWLVINSEEIKIAASKTSIYVFKQDKVIFRLTDRISSHNEVLQSMVYSAPFLFYLELVPSNGYILRRINLDEAVLNNSVSGLVSYTVNTSTTLNMNYFIFVKPRTGLDHDVYVLRKATSSATYFVLRSTADYIYLLKSSSLVHSQATFYMNPVVSDNGQFIYLGPEMFSPSLDYELVLSNEVLSGIDFTTLNFNSFAHPDFPNSALFTTGTPKGAGIMVLDGTYNNYVWIETTDIAPTAVFAAPNGVIFTNYVDTAYYAKVIANVLTIVSTAPATGGQNTIKWSYSCGFISNVFYRIIDDQLIAVDLSAFTADIAFFLDLDFAALFTYRSNQAVLYKANTQTLHSVVLPGELVWVIKLGINKAIVSVGATSASNTVYLATIDHVNNTLVYTWLYDNLPGVLINFNSHITHVGQPELDFILLNNGTSTMGVKLSNDNTLLPYSVNKNPGQASFYKKSVSSITYRGANAYQAVLRSSLFPFCFYELPNSLGMITQSIEPVVPVSEFLIPIGSHIFQENAINTFYKVEAFNYFRRLIGNSTFFPNKIYKLKDFIVATISDKISVFSYNENESSPLVLKSTYTAQYSFNTFPIFTPVDFNNNTFAMIRWSTTTSFSTMVFQIDISGELTVLADTWTTGVAIALSSKNGVIAVVRQNTTSDYDFLLYAVSGGTLVLRDSVNHTGVTITNSVALPGYVGLSTASENYFYAYSTTAFTLQSITGSTRIYQWLLLNDGNFLVIRGVFDAVLACHVLSKSGNSYVAHTVNLTAAIIHEVNGTSFVRSVTTLPVTHTLHYLVGSTLNAMLFPACTQATSPTIEKIQLISNDVFLVTSKHNIGTNQYISYCVSVDFTGGTAENKSFLKNNSGQEFKDLITPSVIHTQDNYIFLTAYSSGYTPIFTPIKILPTGERILLTIPSIPTSYLRGSALHATKPYFACASNASPFLYLYKIVGDDVISQTVSTTVTSANNFLFWFGDYLLSKFVSGGAWVLHELVGDSLIRITAPVMASTSTNFYYSDQANLGFQYVSTTVPIEVYNMQNTPFERVTNSNLGVIDGSFVGMKVIYHNLVPYFIVITSTQVTAFIIDYVENQVSFTLIDSIVPSSSSLSFINTTCDRSIEAVETSNTIYHVYAIHNNRIVRQAATTSCVYDPFTNKLLLPVSGTFLDPIDTGVIISDSPSIPYVWDNLSPAHRVYTVDEDFIAIHTNVMYIAWRNADGTYTKTSINQIPQYKVGKVFFNCFYIPFSSLPNHTDTTFFSLSTLNRPACICIKNGDNLLTLTVNYNNYANGLYPGILIEYTATKINHYDFFIDNANKKLNVVSENSLAECLLDNLVLLNPEKGGQVLPNIAAPYKVKRIPNFKKLGYSWYSTINELLPFKG